MNPTSSYPKKHLTNYGRKTLFIFQTQVENFVRKVRQNYAEKYNGTVIPQDLQVQRNRITTGWTQFDH